MKDKGKHSKAGGSAYIDMNQLKKKEVSQSKCQSVLESISDNNMLTMKN